VLPGNWNRTVFDSASVPSSRDRLNRNTGVCVRNIRQVADTIICDVIIRPESVSIAEGLPPYARHPLLTIAPNPARSGSFLRLTTGPLDHSTTSSLSLFSPSGSLLSSFTLRTSSLILPPLPPGIYVLRLQTGMAVATSKLVVTAD
jgi:hypothetical protein